MSYKIAVASSDGSQVDETFGSAKGFLIYEVEEESYQKIQERVFHPEEEGIQSLFSEACSTEGNLPKESGEKHGCRDNRGNGKGCGCGGGKGCGGMSEKVELILDCRCVICKKIGFQVGKQLERKAISYFDVSCPVEEALDKVTSYFYKLDNHKSLRGNK